MAHPLDGCFAKLGRVDSQLAEFKVRVAAHKANSYRIEKHKDYHLLQATYVFRLDTPWPEELSLVIGEIAYHMRSCLDHLVWQLVLLNGNRPPKECAFPVYDAPGKNPFAGSNKLVGVSDFHKGLIEKLQPYNDLEPRKHPLLLLSALCNVDKHRVLHVAETHIGELTAVGVSIGPGFFQGVSNPLRDGAVFLQNSFHVAGLLTQFSPDIRVCTDIHFGEGSDAATGLPVVETLERCRQYLHDHIFDYQALLQGFPPR